MFLVLLVDILLSFLWCHIGCSYIKVWPKKTIMDKNAFFCSIYLYHILTMLNILLKSLHTVVNIVKIDVGIF